MTLNPNITELKSTGKINLMLYGPPGVGKTSLIGGGPRTLIVHPPTDHVDAIAGSSSAKEWVVENWDDMGEVEEFARHNPKEFDWIWLDSLSLFQDHGLEDIFDKMVAGKPHRAGGPIDQGEYGLNFVRIKNWVRHMVGIPGFNFGLTAHPAEVADNLGNTKLRPWVQGKNMAFAICGYMNVVAYMEVIKDRNGKLRRVLRFEETDEYTAKDQKIFNFPNHRLADPTMTKLIQAGPKPAAKRRATARRK